MTANIIGSIPREEVYAEPVVALRYRWLPYVWVRRVGKETRLTAYRFHNKGRSWGVEVSLNGLDPHGLRRLKRMRVRWYEVGYLKAIP